MRIYILQILDQLYDEGIVVFTPSRMLDNKKISSHDDFYILDYAWAVGAVVISKDNFRAEAEVTGIHPVYCLNVFLTAIAEGGP